MNLKNIYMIVEMIFVILAVKTMLPDSKAKKMCLLEYKASCSFAPVSSLILFWVACFIFFVQEVKIIFQ
jgi:hypothetical protein